MYDNDSVDKPRASRDGHEFHENWAARKVLQLLWPKDNLIGVTLEGFHPADNKKAGAEAVEIADVTLYHGKRPTFKGAERVVIIQLKYSISHADKGFRCSHAKKTISKFAKAYADFKAEYGAEAVQKKLQFELVTNRPIHPEFAQALEDIKKGIKTKGKVQTQAKQFAATSKLKGKSLIEFANKIVLSGAVGDLIYQQRCISRTLADWLAARDHMSRAHLGALKQLLRDKAGGRGQRNNLVKLVDVLDVLEVDQDALFPCPDSFPEVGAIVEREQFQNSIEEIKNTNKPILIHASGGIGKTVFLQSLVNHYKKDHEVILFDCFGGGAYRAPEDSRHLPKKAFVHIVNSLSCKGLCDPLIPSNASIDDLLRTVRIRFEQAVDTLRRSSPDGRLMLFIDAADNSAEFALERKEECFATELLKNAIYKCMPNVTIIFSCRTERRPIVKGDLDCHEIPLDPFSLAETKAYLEQRIKKVSATEIAVAHARSGGNPRVLEHLVQDRKLLGESEVSKKTDLDDLLKARIDSALKGARERGYKKKDIDSFLAGLAVLPPPVPVEEYSVAQGIEVSAIESFLADLAPLLERTKHGIWFRDEPTETLIRKEYSSHEAALTKVADNLFEQQDSSVYAAKALPNLLYIRGDGDKLFALAFDDRFPAEITSTIGKQAIRYERLKAAASYAVHTRNYNHLVRSLIELSTIQALDERGAEYILNSPDLIVVARDVDATRRLFELRTAWQGTRHARLAIAHLLSGERNEAYRHAVRAEEWIEHFSEQDDQYKRDKRGYEKMDISSIPLCILAQGRSKSAIRWLRGWKNWFAYEVSEHLFSFINTYNALASEEKINIEEFLKHLTTETGLIAGALSFVNPDLITQVELTKKLAAHCEKAGSAEFRSDWGHGRSSGYSFRDGLLQSSALALAHGLQNEALRICLASGDRATRIWSFNEGYDVDKIAEFILKKVIISIAQNHMLQAMDLLPKEITDMEITVEIDIKSEECAKEIKKQVLKKVEEQKEGKAEDEKAHAISYEREREIEKFFNDRFYQICQISLATRELLISASGAGDQPFKAFIGLWLNLKGDKPHNGYRENEYFFMDRLGKALIAFFLWSRRDLTTPSIKEYLCVLDTEKEHTSSYYLIDCVSILSNSGVSADLVGELATKAYEQIKREDDVNTRSNLYIKLARAILPVSQEESAYYFKEGLAQVDIIGSGDYSFTNELLLFASSLYGKELSEQEFHTLFNICELNMGDEEEKFPWFAFGQAASRVSGIKGLARLSRWSDRGRVALKYTLMPYLTSLVKDKKIVAETATALLRLTDPSGGWDYNMSTFTTAIDRKDCKNYTAVIEELLSQFEENNPTIFSETEAKGMCEISEKVLGSDNQITSRLEARKNESIAIRDSMNHRSSYSWEEESLVTEERRQREKDNVRELQSLIDDTDLSSETSIAAAVEKLENMRDSHTLTNEYLEGIRSKVPYDHRSGYIRIIANLENLFFYRKLDELKSCKENWGGSSRAIKSTFEEIGVPLMRKHAEEFIINDRLSISALKIIEQISGVTLSCLILELIKIIISSGFYAPSEVWMSLASTINKEADSGEGQAALIRLLNSNISELSSSVPDGKWSEKSYPSSDEDAVAAKLVWMQLGSPYAANRWLAAHTVRRFAKMGKWPILRKLIELFNDADAGEFQAPELKFYYMHARLWLLIALDRTAMDYPEEVAKHSSTYKQIAFSKDMPHILMRHFAARILMTCNDNRFVKLSRKELGAIKEVNKPSQPHLMRKHPTYNDWYAGRPEGSTPKHPEFYLEYDFGKTEVMHLGNIFGKTRWEMEGILTGWVRKFDSTVEGMHDSGGREKSRRMGITDDYHTYGEQLAWHALFLSAGQLLTDSQVIITPYEDEDPWQEWLAENVITHPAGWWLSDGSDTLPLGLQTPLMERQGKDLVITSQPESILKLVKVHDSDARPCITIEGAWTAYDGIRVAISSSLVPPDQAKNLACALCEEDPFHAYLPKQRGEFDEGVMLDEGMKAYEAWTTSIDLMSRLDELDPLASGWELKRYKFSSGINTLFSLHSEDAFGRRWKDKANNLIATSEAWGYTSERDKHDSSSRGRRLIIRENFLKEVLEQKNKSLLLYIKLEKYEEGGRYKSGKYHHTTAAVVFNKSIEHIYYAGHTNKLHKSRY